MIGIHKGGKIIPSGINTLSEAYYMCLGRRRTRIESVNTNNFRLPARIDLSETGKKVIGSDDSIDRHYCIVLFLITRFVVVVAVAAVVAAVAGTVLFDVHISDKTYT